MSKTMTTEQDQDLILLQDAYTRMQVHAGQVYRAGCDAVFAFEKAVSGRHDAHTRALAVAMQALVNAELARAQAADSAWYFAEYAKLQGR